MKNNILKNSLVVIFTIVLISIFSSCRKDELYTGNEKVLVFTSDTLTFDTVFTTIGTVTRYFRVNNTSEKIVSLDIALKNIDGLQTFRINVDGESGKHFEDVKIPPNDYIYIFAEATIDPGNVNNPFVVGDVIEYKYNNTIQKSFLQAWGQDAYFHYGEIDRNHTNAIWLNDKPHVVVRNSTFPGYAADSTSSITIQPGCRIYVAPNSGIYIEGELYIGNATNQDSVIFQSSRLETLQNGTNFTDKPGMWTGIVLFSGAKAEIYNTIINQSESGIQGRHTSSEIAVLIDNTGRPDILLEKVQIKNASRNAIVSINSKIKATNCLFHSTGNHTVAIALGGSVAFDNCTMHTNGTSGSNDSEILVLSNFLQTNKGAGLNHLTNADFTNCIIYANAEEQIVLSQDEQVDFNYSFKNCLLKTQLENQTNFTDCIFNQNPDFVSISDDNFNLESSSPCIATGFNNGILDDLYFNTRTNFDIGAIAY